MLRAIDVPRTRAELWKCSAARNCTMMIAGPMRARMTTAIESMKRRSRTLPDFLAGLAMGRHRSGCLVLPGNPDVGHVHAGNAEWREFETMNVLGRRVAARARVERDHGRVLQNLAFDPPVDVLACLEVDGHAGLVKKRIHPGIRVAEEVALRLR